MERVSIFVDGAQMAMMANRMGQVISPRALLHALIKGRTLQRAIWYQPLTPEEYDKAKFLYYFVAQGRLFDLVTKAPGTDMDAELATDFLEEVFCAHPEVMILVSGDGDFLKPVRLAREQGIRVEIASSEKLGMASPMLVHECDEFIELVDILQKMTKE